MRTTRYAFIGAVALAAVLLAGCPRGGDESAASAPGNDAVAPTAAPSAGAPSRAPNAPSEAPFVQGAVSVPANIGANVDPPVYYSSSAQYVDMMRMASPWQAPDSGANLQEIGKVDANGWPMQDFKTNVGCCQMLHGIPVDTPNAKSYLVGGYQLSFNGKADLDLLVGSFKDQHYDPATNTTTVTAIRTADDTRYDGDAHMILSFWNTQRTASSPVNTGVTNIHMIRPQYAPDGQKWWDSPTQTFTNLFLKAYAPFTTLRFMDWTATNGNQQVEWSDRTPGYWPTTGHEMQMPDGTWSGTGESWESAIELANTLHKDMWINVPAHADDDYVLQLATLLRDKLDPGLNVYVEYSNETWNWGFEQWHYLDAKLQPLWSDSPPDPALAKTYLDNCASGSGEVCATAARIVDIDRIFSSVWGAGAINQRIRPVLCSQEVQPGLAWNALRFVNEVYGTPAKYFYGLCSAPYWGADVNAGESLDDLLAASKASIPGWDSYLIGWAEAARFYGLHNFTYEGGTGMTDQAQANLPTLLAANADPRMGQQVTEALTDAFANGVDMYMYYTGSGAWSKYGAWGATDGVVDLARPKYQALLALQGKLVPRTLDVTTFDPSTGKPAAALHVPGSLNGGYPSFKGDVVGGVLKPYGNATWCSHDAGGDRCFMTAPGADTRFVNDTFQGYSVVVDQAGTYTVILNLYSGVGQGAAAARFYVNQRPQGGTMQIAASPANTPDRKSTSIQVDLPAGFSLVEVEATQGNFYLSSVDISR